MPSGDSASLTARPEWPLLVALVIGLLIGLERERRKGEGMTRAPAGVRTFALVGLAGGLVALIDNIWLTLVVGGFIALSTLAAYVVGEREDPGLTGEVAMMVTFVLGVLARSQSAIAFGVAVVVASLLAFRAPLHRFVREKISEQELLDTLTFAIAAVVVLPLLPNKAIDPFGLLNPFTLWRLAVVAMALSFLGHVAQRLLGGRFGLLVAGLASGLVSSTAAVAAMGARSKADSDLANASAAGAVASMIGSLGYLAAIIGAVSPRLVMVLAAPLGFAATLLVIYAAWLVRHTSGEIVKTEPEGRAFNVLALMLFVALVGGFSVASELLLRWMGPAGAMAGAAIMALADAHAAAVSMATMLAGNRLPLAVAAGAVMFILTVNMAVKVPTAFVGGTRAFAGRVTVGVSILLIGAWAGALPTFLGWTAL